MTKTEEQQMEMRFDEWWDEEGQLHLYSRDKWIVFEGWKAAWKSRSKYHEN